MKYLFIAFLTSISFISSALDINNQYKVKNDIKNPIIAEKTAQTELTTYLTKIFGPTGKNASKFIILKYNDKFGREEFTISNDKNGNVIISGGRPRGVLYGCYYFLDRKLGVKWLTPNFEYVPKAKKITVNNLTYHGKPAFNARIMQSNRHKENTPQSRRWRARNLYNSAFDWLYETDETFGEELIFSPPAQCHGLHRVIPPEKYFKSNPEFWALQFGKRTHRDKKGVTADYCLTNEKLIQTTIKECRSYLQKNPTARYISIQEGDFTRGYCDCKNCKDLVAKHGKKESARWVYFANKVASALKNEFPKTQILIFAYAASRQPPQNMKALDNVCVQLCAFNNRRGLPYNNPKNKIGRNFIEQLKQWKKICKNILIWDYTYGFVDRMIQTPDLLTNVDNFKTFQQIGIDGIFPENGVATDFSFAMPLRAWLLTRLMWNPSEGDFRKLVVEFCTHYYGKTAGIVAANYHLNLCDINNKQQFVNVATGGGAIGNAKYLSTDTTISSYLSIKKVLDEEKNPVYKERIRKLFAPIQYQVLIDYTNISATKKIKATQQEIANDIIKLLDQDKTTTKNLILMMKKSILDLLKLKDIKAKTNILYGKNYPAKAYDGDIKTVWHPGNGSGWCQIEFDKVREINRITTVFGSHNNIVRGENEIMGSLDGKNFFPIVKRRTIKEFGNYHYLYADDKLPKPVKTKFVRTRCFSAYTKTIRNDVLIHEQYFNLKELPKAVTQTRK